MYDTTRLAVRLFSPWLIQKQVIPDFKSYESITETFEVIGSCSTEMYGREQNPAPFQQLRKDVKHL